MLLLRILAYVALITIGASVVVALVTGNRRYLRFAWQVLKYSLLLALLVFGLMLLERLVLVPL